MKSFLLCALLALWLPGGLSAAPVDYNDQYVYNIFKKREGKWDLPANWSAKHVPVVPEDVVIRDNTGVVVDTKVPAVRSILLGGKGGSSLTLSKGGVLSIENQLRVGRTEAGTGGVFALEGGLLTTGTAGLKHRLAVGDSSTYSSTGIAYLRSGTFCGGISVGSPLPNTGVGTLSVVGASVSAGAKLPDDNLLVTPFGTVEFVLDADSVSTLDYKNAVPYFAQGSAIRVVGERYAGPSKTILLIAAKHITDKGAAITCVGFADKYKVKTAFDRRGLVLTIQSK